MYIKQDSLNKKPIEVDSAVPNKSTMDIYEKNNNSNLNVNKSQICAKCFTPLNSYQLNLNECLKICTNLDCLGDLKTTEIVQRDFSDSQPFTEKFNSFYTQEKYIDSDTLTYKFSSYLSNEIKKLDNLLEKYTQPKIPILFEDQNEISFVEQLFQNETQNQFDKDAEILENTNFVTQDVQMEIVEPVVTTSNFFDDNFFSDISNLLENDYSLAENNFLGLENTQTHNSYKTFLNTQTESNPVFTDLQPVKQEDVASHLANEMLEIDFINANNTSGYSPEIIKTVHQSKNSNSSISISKIQDKSQKDIKISSLKLIDEKDDLLALINAPKSDKIDKKSELNQKSMKTKSGALLPWEVKSKDLKRKNKIEIKPDTPKSSKVESKIPRVESNHNPNSSIKELSSVLKRNLLNDNSILSNFNVKKNSNLSMLSNSLSIGSSGGGTSGGGYKDLVLSVLKKKTNATTS
ncbi:unnamed protein product [Brachionus calyciflorus]|uniref:Uncharacterized protein n=1 Tax=Brachionus calyciflorus TaxID=104777 RepID=A0A813N8P3_9BILA|nr:unnamed protein product [Brachionus calyciflorus]